ncbi:hypothetical protein ACHAXT_001034 [Thalassiosira profunda]
MAPTTPKTSPDAPHKNLRMTPQRQRRSSLGALSNGAGAQRGRPKTSVNNRDKENSAHADTGLAGRGDEDEDIFDDNESPVGSETSNTSTTVDNKSSRSVASQGTATHAHNASASFAGSSAGSETVIPDGWLASRVMTARAPATASFSISVSSTSFDSIDEADPPSVVLPGVAGDDGDISVDSKLEISQITGDWSYDAVASEADGFAAVDAFAQTGASLKGGVTVTKEPSDNCDEEQDVLVAITAKPENEHLSFEELRLRDYVANHTSASNDGSVDEVDGVDGEELSNETLSASEKDELLSRLKDMAAVLARSDAEKRTLSMENAQLKDQCSDLTKSLSDSNARILDLEQQLADQQNGAIGDSFDGKPAVDYYALYHKVDDELHQETLKSEELSKDVETLSDKVTELQWDNDDKSMLLEVANEQLEAQRKRFNEKEIEKGELIDEVAALTKGKDALQKQLHDAKESAVATKSELESANSSLAREKVAIEEQLESAVLEKEALSKQVSTQAEENTQLDEMCKTLKKSEASLKEENNTLTVEKEALSKQLNTLTEEKTQLEEQCNSLKESEATLKKASASLTVETGELNVRVNALASKNATLQVQVGAITEQRDDLHVQCEEQKTTIAQLLDQDDSFLYQYDSDESEWEFVAYERDQLAQKLDEAKAEISELKEKLSSRGAIIAQRMQEEKDAVTDRIRILTDENEKLAREVKEKVLLARKVDSLKKKNQQLRQEVEVRKVQWQQHCTFGDN